MSTVFTLEIGEIEEPKDVLLYKDVADLVNIVGACNKIDNAYQDVEFLSVKKHARTCGWGNRRRRTREGARVCSAPYKAQTLRVVPRMPPNRTQARGSCRARGALCRDRKEAGMHTNPSSSWDDTVTPRTRLLYDAAACV